MCAWNSECWPPSVRFGLSASASGAARSCGLVEDDEVVVQHADAGHAGRGQRPGGVEAGFAGQHQMARRVGIALQHVVDDDLVHAVPDLLHRRRDLGAAHRAAERVEDGLRGVVDHRGVELVAVAQRLAIEQQALGVAQQAVVVRQVLQVFGAVEELVGFHPLRHGERDGAEGREDFPGADLHAPACAVAPRSPCVPSAFR
jgi:hypothetical protein